MGCFGSRFDSRNKHCGDLNTVGLQFVGGEAHVHDLCPVDRFVLATGEGEFADQYKCSGTTASDEEQVKAIYLATHKAVTALHADLTKKVADAGGKDPWEGGKYKLSVAVAQLADVLKNFNEKSGIEVPKEEAPAAGGEVPAAGGEEAKEEEKVEAEGGEEGEAAAAGGEEKKDEPVAMEKSDPHKYDDDGGSYDGWANVPALFIRQATVNPYWGDLVKAQLVQWEFNQGGKEPSGKEWLGAAGLITSALATAAGEEKEVWLSGHVGADDFESLKGMAESGPILFPGWQAGWATQEEATSALALLEQNGDQKTHNAIFKVTGGSVFPFVKCRLFGHRLAGKLTKLTTEGELNTFEVTAEKWAGAATIADWRKALEEAKNAPAATVEAAPAEGAPAEGDQPPAEGGDQPPAEAPAAAE